MYAQSASELGTSAIRVPASPGVSEARRTSPPPGFDSTYIIPNDNRRSAGRWRGDTLHVELEARMGMWYPESTTGMGLQVAAFAEAGAALLTPGPLIRAPQGAHVVVVIVNHLTKTLTMRGLGITRGLADSVRVEPGSSYRFEFSATTPGTFYYAASTGRSPILSRGESDSQLHGAIVVDAAGSPRMNDRVFVISWWYKTDNSSPTGLERVTMAINGRSWPHTEPLNVAQGDSLHWRWINLTIVNHPMHLHGFYFRVDGVGDGTQYSIYAPGARRDAVTELMLPGGTMEFSWSPSRPGNWLLHCHVASHMSHLVALGTERGIPEAHTHQQHGMAGLVMGIHVAPSGAAAPLPSRYRPLRLSIDSRSNVYAGQPGYRYRLGEDSAVPDTTFASTGPTLVLAQHEPVAVTIVNRSHEPAAVHWHGIELDSYPDGVPGFSGDGTSVLPAIAPGDSLTVRFTPTRAGTFMYHSHFNEIGQISSGLHGAIVVLPPEKIWTPDTDKVLLFSDDGPTGNLLNGPFPATRVNGKMNPDTLHLAVGVTYRLRFINIRTDYTLEVSMSSDAGSLTWTPIAKDGADLPHHQVIAGGARFTFGPGEIHDVAFTPTHPGTLLLRHVMTEFPPPLRQRGSIPVLVR